jgi:hypothetical protein
VKLLAERFFAPPFWEEKKFFNHRHDSVKLFWLALPFGRQDTPVATGS